MLWSHGDTMLNQDRGHALLPGLPPQHHSPSGTLCFFPGPLPASCLAFQDSSQVYCSPSHTRLQRNLKRTLSHRLVSPGARQAFPDLPPPPAAATLHSSFPLCAFCHRGLCSYLTPATSHAFQVQVHILRFPSKLPEILRNVCFLAPACSPSVFAGQTPAVW